MTGIAVAGVTASGKSDLAAELAVRYGGEVISCDSMLVYRGCDIGTAKPSETEKRGITHHLIDIFEPEQPFSAADFSALCERAEADILARGNLPVICGGTGLYLDCFLRGGLPDSSVKDEGVRARLEAECAELGTEAMYKRLEALDPEAARTMHANNVRRVIRALEIIEVTGKTKTELDRETPQRVCVKDYGVIALDYSDRELRSAYIEARVRKMFDMGLAEETQRLREQGVFEKCAAAAQAIGYKELFLYLDGKESREEAIMRLTYATRRYAKRQTTWYAALPYAKHLYVDENGKRKSLAKIADEAARLLELNG
ncbi:MAG: tRNA (adenosine(37)-N6)-dimethylallyltransferase MiaA [Clostridia bacterium]|nr:tRNA (adenosine(37)-N6)-dimethylallyltransferase MiaA [Clostridia bacterium]